MRTRSVLLWPFELLWGLLRLLFWPALVLGLAYVSVTVFSVPWVWFVLVAVLVCVYTMFVLRIWLTVVHGSIRAMARGTVTVRNQSPRRRRRASRGVARR